MEVIYIIINSNKTKGHSAILLNVGVKYLLNSSLIDHNQSEYIRIKQEEANYNQN